ncbi:hypothetical protein JG688_00015858 [Phytophthora aleatoria]|uniref:Uncharacterized protein n=1 Tax=Phytophthora aleatoria TaxID=2496075 RepID=A0A8J5M2G0_9STRA|nr:hypothetical protein JG688_00015858 [Phytophthora aleatoria]
MILMSRGLRLPAKEDYDTSIESKVDYVEEFLLHKAPRGNDMGLDQTVFAVAKQHINASLDEESFVTDSELK